MSPISAAQIVTKFGMDLYSTILHMSETKLRSEGPKQWGLTLGDNVNVSSPLLSACANIGRHKSHHIFHIGSVYIFTHFLYYTYKAESSGKGIQCT